MTIVLEEYGRLPCDSGWGSQKCKKGHLAIDIGWLTKYGAKLPVKAWKSGVVVATGTDSVGGVYVVLKHEDIDCLWISRYWHFVKGSIKVTKGQTVTQGQVLGTRGNSGISTGVHLHFEIWKCPKGYNYKSSDCSKYAVDPIKYTYIFDGQVFSQAGQFMLNKKETKPIPVMEDETKHQVQVIVSKLRVRKAATLEGEQVCYCTKGIYDVLQTHEADGYLWFEIETNRWIATKEGEWTIDLLPSKNQENTSFDFDELKQLLQQKDEIINKLCDGIKEVFERIKNIKDEVSVYEG